MLFLEIFRFQEWIVSNDSHTKCTTKFADSLTDTTEAHNTQSLAAKLTTFEFIFVPLVFYFYIVVSCESTTGDI